MKWLSTDDLIKQQKTKSDIFILKNEHNTNWVKAIRKNNWSLWDSPFLHFIKSRLEYFLGDPYQSNNGSRMAFKGYVKVKIMQNEYWLLTYKIPLFEVTFKVLGFFVCGFFVFFFLVECQHVSRRLT